MSMNLYAKCKSGEIELWQTPTQITYMILVDGDGVVRSAKGYRAKRALHSYIRWVEGSMDGAWKSEKELNDYREIVKSHVEYVKSFLDKAGLKVYYL